MYLVHSKEQCKTSLAEYWGGGGVHGRSIYLSDYHFIVRWESRINFIRKCNF